MGSPWPRLIGGRETGVSLPVPWLGDGDPAPWEGFFKKITKNELFPELRERFGEQRSGYDGFYQSQTEFVTPNRIGLFYVDFVAPRTSP